MKLGQKEDSERKVGSTMEIEEMWKTSFPGTTQNPTQPSQFQAEKFLAIKLTANDTILIFNEWIAKKVIKQSKKTPPENQIETQ